MSRPRVLQLVTRWVRGGARQVVQALLDRLPGLGFEPLLACGPGEPPPGAVVVPGLVRELRPLGDLAASFRIERLIRKLRPDVLHAHTYKAGVLGCLAGRAAGLRAVVFSPHGHIFGRDSGIPGVPRGWKLEGLRQLTSFAGFLARRVVALNELDRRQQVGLGLAAPEKCVVVRNGIDVDRYAARAPRLFGDGPVVGAVGRLESEKGHAVLLEAMALVRRSRPDARLVIVGAGSLDAELRRRAGEGVVFAGERDAADVLGSFDVFAQPSLYEAQGIAVLEAMAAGVPVAATEVGGMPDAVRPGETGLLVKPSDPAALAAALLRLLENRAEAAALASGAKSLVRAEFSVGRMLDDYARLYREVL
jgi:glycosyltransferase involved in cell wall biosynthesis